MKKVFKIISTILFVFSFIVLIADSYNFIFLIISKIISLLYFITFIKINENKINGLA